MNTAVPTAPLPSLDLTKYEGHTPGPWLLERLSGDFTYGVRVNGDCVSGYTAFIRADWVHADQRAELEVNARLITDAPQLLAALLTMQREREEILFVRNGLMIGVRNLEQQLAASERTCAELSEKLNVYARAVSATDAIYLLHGEIDKLRARAEAAERTVADWIRENGPSGWIGKLRQDLAKAQAELARLEGEGESR